MIKYLFILIHFAYSVDFDSPYMEKYEIIGTHCQYFGDRNGQPVIPLGDLKNHNFTNVNPIINSSYCSIKYILQTVLSVGSSSFSYY